MTTCQNNIFDGNNIHVYIGSLQNEINSVNWPQ